MGDRTTAEGVPCGHCGAVQSEVYYAPSIGFLSHVCEKCAKPNIIVERITLKAATPEEVDAHYTRHGFTNP